MGEPRADKVAIVAEVKAKFENADSVLITEYRGLNVPAMADLRSAIGAAGGEYRVYKNTLVRFAANELGLEIDELLVGPTAIAFIGEREDGTKGDAAGVAKAVVEFGKDNEALVVKGGILDSEMLSLEQITSLSKIASREELLSRLAGGLAAPMQRFASLLQALPRDFAYGLQALIDEGGASGAPAPTVGSDTPA
jgi:large subunit ribosomal protein L10